MELRHRIIELERKEKIYSNLVDSLNVDLANYKRQTQPSTLMSYIDTDLDLQKLTIAQLKSLEKAVMTVLHTKV